jgi:polysaccharide export outer membrane protein
MTTMHSCVPAKKFVYFNNLKDDSLEKVVVVQDSNGKYSEPIIQSNDILNVNIQTLVQNENNAPVEPTGSPSTNLLGGYLVDKNGYIELGLIGFVKVGGLTTTEARELIKHKAEVYYKEPAIRVRIANFEVKVLGDVVRPGVFNVASEKATVLDILAMAGDLNITAKRNNILLARTEGSQTKFVRLDLTSSSIFQSPYFYVQPRDYIYVEASNFKRQSSDNSFTRYLSYGSGVIGIISLLFLTRIIK